MGKASRTKRDRRRAGTIHGRREGPNTAEFEVFCPGVLEVLSIGKGDLKLTLDGKNPDDVERARRLVEEMLRKGYSIFVETDDGPVRVKKFNPKRMTYIIVEVADEADDLTGAECPACGKHLAPPRYDLSKGVLPEHRVGRGRSAFCVQGGKPFDAAVPPSEPPKRRARERHVPVAGSRATAVGRTAGG